ncbi:hypothetical protein ACVWXO_001286 [Bradyrhizobium sp. LM2.7]
MHIEPGIVTGAKLVLRYATGIATGCVIAKLVVAKQIGRRECEGICRPPLLEGMLLLIATMAVVSPVLLKRCVRFPR